MNVPTQPETNSVPQLCAYNTSYQSIYQPSYDMLIVFYDEDEGDNDDWTDCVPPLPTSSGFANG